MKLINVMASSLDGRIGLHRAEGDDERQMVGISGASDQKFLRQQIESCDAIVVGASSIRANGVCLEHSGNSGKPPVWYIFLENPLPPDAPFWTQFSVPRVLISKKPLSFPRESQVVNWVYGDEEPSLFLRDRLVQLGHKVCLLFGGGIINSWFYKNNLVDELRLTIAPVLVAKKNSPFLVAPELSEIVKFSLLTSHVEENFVFLTYQVIR